MDSKTTNLRSFRDLDSLYLDLLSDIKVVFLFQLSLNRVGVRYGMTSLAKVENYLQH